MTDSAASTAMLYRLHNACPVKWTAVQERSISREFPTIPAETGAERVLRTYSQFLWLPQVSHASGALNAWRRARGTRCSRYRELVCCGKMLGARAKAEKRVCQLTGRVQRVPTDRARHDFRMHITLGCMYISRSIVP